MRPIYRTSVVVFILTFILYLLTSGPTFGFIDEGELAAVAATGGVAHPTGYPTLTMLGGLVTLLPFRDISELIVLAALLTALGAGVAVVAFERLLRYVGEEEEGNEGKGEKGTGFLGIDRRSAIAGVGGLAIGLCGIWWRQGTGFEVYALHAFFLPLLLFLFVRWIVFEESRGDDRSGVPFTKEGTIFAVVLGLSFTNHMTTILLAPAFLSLFFSRFGIGLPALRRLPGLIPGFLVGLLPYLWLPLRAAADPRFNWSNPESLWALERHLSGAQYGVWIFTNPQSFALQSGFIFPTLAEEFLWVGLLIALVGIWHLFSRPLWTAPTAIVFTASAVALLLGYDGDSVSGVVVPVVLFGVVLAALPFVTYAAKGGGRKRLDPDHARRPMQVGAALLLLVLTTFLYAGGYDILDIESYYLAAVLGIGGLIVFGVDCLMHLFDRRVVLGGMGIILAGMLVANWQGSDRSDLWLVEDAAHNMLTTVPPNTVIVSGLWDFWLSGSWYLQAVEGVRPDVAVIDHNLLKYSWCIDQLEVAHPELMERVAGEVAAFREQGYLFERDLPYDALTIDRRYVAMIDAMIATSLKAGRPVMLTFDLNERTANGYRYGAAWAPPDRRVPWGLGYMINPSGEYLPQEFPDWRFRKSSRGPDGYEASLYQWYATAARDRAQYEALHGRDSLAREYLVYGLRFDPEWNWNPEEAGPLAQGMSERITQMVATFAQMRAALSR